MDIILPQIKNKPFDSTFFIEGVRYY